MPNSTTGNLHMVPQARLDLTIVPADYRGERFWTIKDPIASRFYQFRDEERFILGQLDGRVSLDDVVARFNQRFAPRRLRPAELSAFLGMLHQEGLVASPALGQGEQLLARESAHRRRAWLSAMTNLLAIRLPGINPDRWLTAAAPGLAWLYSPACLGLALLLIVVAMLVVVVNFTVLRERLPRFGEFFGPGNIVWLALSMALVKSLHELGHAVTCKRFGGAVNRLGIMLLVFTPALYCDVSDAWLFRSKWQRIAVSGAGVAVELILAAMATLIWSMTQPGVIHALALNVMFVCSVGTLLINGNPLLRYDGYHVLADWLETPNLSQQASAVLRRGLAGLLTGVELEPPRLLAAPGSVFLWSFAVASLLYRGIVIVGVLWFIDGLLRPHGLAAISQLAAAVVLVSVFTDPLVRTVTFLRNPRLARQIHWGRLTVGLLLIACLLAGVAMIPIPARVTAPVVTQPADGRQMFVTTGGVLTFARQAGEQVAAGQTVAQLVNRQLEAKVTELASRESQQRLHLSHLTLRQHREPELSDQLPAAEKRLSDLSEQLAQMREELSALKLVAPQAGTILPPPRRSADADHRSLAALVGTPQEPQNLGCYLEPGTLLCTIADPAHLEALAIIEQGDLAGLREGQAVRVALAQIPGNLLTGQVREISRIESAELPPPIVAERMIPLRTGRDGRPESVKTYYQASITLDSHSPLLLVGATGWAKIVVDPQPLWLRAYRALRGTFRTPW
jgi:putative peptide zinc metalloprotease protein